MTFPVIASTNSWYESGNVESHTINMPSWIQAWDLLVVLFTINWWDLPDAFSWWNTIYTQDTWYTFCWSAYWKIADGTEWATQTITSTGNSEQSAHYSMRITWFNTVSLDVTWIAKWNANNNSNKFPNPPSLSPARWSDDNLWIAVAHGNLLGTSWTSVPSSYSWWFITSQPWSENAWAWWIWYATRNNATWTEDPWTFSVNTAWTSNWIAWTIAIQPGIYPLPSNPSKIYMFT